MPVACATAVQWVVQIKNYPEDRINRNCNNIWREKDEKFRVKFTLLKGTDLGQRLDHSKREK